MIPGVSSGAPKALVTMLWAAILAAPAACDPAGPEPRGPIDDDTYVMVVSELADIRRFPPGGRDQLSRDAAADSARREVLDRYGVTVDELLSFAEIVGEHPARMVEIAEQISTVTDSLARLRARGEPTEAAADSAEVPTDAADGAASTDTADGDTGADTARATEPRPIDEREEALRERADRLRGLRGGRAP